MKDHRGRVILEDDRDICGFGILSLPPDHPFSKACARHDRWFTRKALDEPTPGRRRVDDLLLREMLHVAKERQSMSLKLQAYTYYAIARLVGKLFWET